MNEVFRGVDGEIEGDSGALSLPICGVIEPAWKAGECLKNFSTEGGAHFSEEETVVDVVYEFCLRLCGREAGSIQNGDK